MIADVQDFGETMLATPGDTEASELIAAERYSQESSSRRADAQAAPFGRTIILEVSELSSPRRSSAFARICCGRNSSELAGVRRGNAHGIENWYIATATTERRTHFARFGELGVRQRILLKRANASPCRQGSEANCCSSNIFAWTRGIQGHDNLALCYSNSAAPRGPAHWEKQCVSSLQNQMRGGKSHRATGWETGGCARRL